jgi:hypothetical protein
LPGSNPLLFQSKRNSVIVKTQVGKQTNQQSYFSRNFLTIHHNEAIGPNQIQTTPTSLGAQQESKGMIDRPAIERIHHGLSRREFYCPIQSHKG